MDYSYVSWDPSNTQHITISNVCTDSSIKSDEQAKEKIRNELKMMEIAKEVEVTYLEDSTEKYYYFYIVSKEELGESSTLIGNNFFIYTKNTMKPERMNAIYIESNSYLKDKIKFKTCECAVDNRFPHSDLLSLIKKEKYFYKVKVYMNDITEIKDGVGKATKVKIIEKIDPPKVNDIINPEYNIKYHIETIKERENSEGIPFLSITVKLANPWWNNNTAYIHINILKDDFETMFNKKYFQECFLNDLQEARNYENLISNIEGE